MLLAGVSSVVGERSSPGDLGPSPLAAVDATKSELLGVVEQIGMVAAL